ncbi:hypothetical protein IFM89_018975, partial [Coptis chinensis]
MTVPHIVIHNNLVSDEPGRGGELEGGRRTRSSLSLNEVSLGFEVLTNGIEVKLQRNALSVIEAPTGLEDDDDLECESMQLSVLDTASDDTQKSQRPRNRPHKAVGSAHKTINRSLSCHSQSKSSISTRNAMKVDLRKLETTVLRRYWRHFKLCSFCYTRCPYSEKYEDHARSMGMMCLLVALKVTF